MNYIKIYNDLIVEKKSLNRIYNKEKYFESHHILPKSLGGTNDLENLVYLTAKEHFIAHLLLAKIYGGKMWYASLRLRTKTDGTILNSCMYETVKINSAKETSKRNSGKRTIKNILTGEHKQYPVGIEIPEGFETSRLGKTHTEETKKIISESRTGIIPVLTEESLKSKKNKLSESHKNGKRVETYKKIAESSKGRINRINMFILTDPKGMEYFVFQTKDLGKFFTDNNLTHSLYLNSNENFKIYSEDMIKKNVGGIPLYCARKYNSIGWSIQKYKRIKI